MKYDFFPSFLSALIIVLGVIIGWFVYQVKVEKDLLSRRDSQS